MKDFDIIPYQGGRFISRGKGSHMIRAIRSNELLFCVKGVLRMFEENNIFELHPGDYYILRKGRMHGGTQKYPGGLSFFWLHFDCDDEIFNHVAQTGHVARHEQLSMYIQSYLSEQQLPNPSIEIQKLLLKLIFNELERAIVNENSVNKVSELALKAEAFVKLHFCEPVNINTAARLLHCNSEYLGRIFHIHFKETFSSMLNRLRAEYAAKLLMNSNLSVKEILNECGFNDPAYFRRIFFKHYASTPTEFRKFYNRGHSNTE